MSFMLVSRDFWPRAASVGDGLLELTNCLSAHGKTHVVTMSAPELTAADANEKINFHTIKPLTHSGSSLFHRFVEIFYFALWVIFLLVCRRPNRIYVATNPPFLIPLLVALYSFCFKKKFVYLVQDIHPEATALVLNIPWFLLALLKKIDTWVLNQAYAVITISKDMKSTLYERGCRTKITLLENPASELDLKQHKKIKGVVFAGNAGRLQNMDIVISAIDKYLSQNGKLPFMFVGGGVFSSQLSKLASKYKSFEYVGRVGGVEAHRIASGFEWGLLPINGEVLKYAFPSKLPSYLAARCKIICCTNMDSSLVKWAHEYDLGFSCDESVEALVSAFYSIENLNGLSQDPSNFYITPKIFGKAISEIFLA